MNTYGYVRVSTKDQNESRQLAAMQEFGVSSNYIILDKQNGKIKVVSVAPLFARAIANVYSNGSVSDLFDPDFAL